MQQRWTADSSRARIFNRNPAVYRPRMSRELKKHSAAGPSGLVSVCLDNQYISATVHFIRKRSGNENPPDYNKAPRRPRESRPIFILLLFFFSVFLSSGCLIVPLACEFSAHRSFCIWGTKSNFFAGVPSRLAIWYRLRAISVRIHYENPFLLHIIHFARVRIHTRTFAHTHGYLFPFRRQARK